MPSAQSLLILQGGTQPIIPICRHFPPWQTSFVHTFLSSQLASLVQPLTQLGTLVKTQLYVAGLHMSCVQTLLSSHWIMSIIGSQQLGSGWALCAQVPLPSACLAQMSWLHLMPSSHSLSTVQQLSLTLPTQPPFMHMNWVQPLLTPQSLSFWHMPQPGTAKCWQTPKLQLSCVHLSPSSQSNFVVHSLPQFGNNL